MFLSETGSYCSLFLWHFFTLLHPVLYGAAISRSLSIDASTKFQVNVIWWVMIELN